MEDNTAKILIRKVPVEVRRRFLAACVKNGISMQGAVIALMDYFGHEDRIKELVDYINKLCPQATTGGRGKKGGKNRWN